LAFQSGWESNYKRELPLARLDSTDPRLSRILGIVFANSPSSVDPIKSVITVRLRKRGEMEGLVGLTRYCCMSTGGKRNPGDSPAQTITFYRDLFDEISDKSAVGVVAHELAHAWLNEHDHPEASEIREKEADDLARRWGYGDYLDALEAETEPV
jgi:hypothetical protein